ncbi:MAG TPA: hypothetical protein VGK33_12640 [Chloroflexota bacterium]
MSTPTGILIDASLRFAKSDPQLLAYAMDSAAEVGVPLDDLLRDAIDRVAAIRAAMHPVGATFTGGRPVLRAV